MFRLKTLPDPKGWQPRLLIFGDLGNDNARTLPMMDTEVQQDLHDFVLHLGGFAYNLEDSNGQVGDAFFRQIEPMASYKPYQVLVGKPEASA